MPITFALTSHVKKALEEARVDDINIIIPSDKF